MSVFEIGGFYSLKGSRKKMGNSYGLKHSLPFQFDGVFFIDKTSESHLLK